MRRAVGHPLPHSIFSWLSVYPPSFPATPQPVKPRGGAPPCRLPSFSTRAVGTVNPLCFKCGRGGSPICPGRQPSPPAQHSVNGDSCPLPETLPTTAGTLGLVPAPAPSLPWLLVGTPHVRPPQSSSLCRTPGQLRRPSLCALLARVSGG